MSTRQTPKRTGRRAPQTAKDGASPSTPPGGLRDSRVSRGRKSVSAERILQRNRVIAHPAIEAERYEYQRDLFLKRFLQLLEWVESRDKKAERSAREELKTLFLNQAAQLLRLALESDDSSRKKWAGMMLASISASVGKYDSKLCKANAAYRDEKAKIGRLRADVLFGKKPIMGAVKRELKQAESYQKRLVRLRYILGKEKWKEIKEKWKSIAKKQGIPEPYWPAADLPKFSTGSKRRWWKFLWPLIKKNNPDLLPKLRKRSERTEVEWVHSEEKSERKFKSRQLWWDSYHGEFRNALYTLARLRSAGTLL